MLYTANGDRLRMTDDEQASSELGLLPVVVCRPPGMPLIISIAQLPLPGKRISMRGARHVFVLG